MLNKLSETIYYLSNQDDRERPTLGLVCGDQYSLIIDYILRFTSGRLRCI